MISETKREAIEKEAMESTRSSADRRALVLIELTIMIEC